MAFKIPKNATNEQEKCFLYGAVKNKEIMQQIAFLDYYAAPQAAYYAIPQQRDFRAIYNTIFPACKMTYTTHFLFLSRNQAIYDAKKS